MRIFALELNNDLKGVKSRKRYIERLISKLPEPDLVVLPELALCSYMASRKIWELADENGKDTKDWAVKTAEKYGCYIGVGYLELENGDYYNRYMIAGPEGVCGTVTKSEGEAAIFKRGKFGSVIKTPFGKVGVGICYDSRRKHFYENVKDEELSLILFPHGAPADPTKPEKEQGENDKRCMMYVDAFGVPVVYVNSKGALEHMPGVMGSMMKKQGFRMNGLSKIYAGGSMKKISCDVSEAVGAELELVPKKRAGKIRFHGKDILPGNFFFRHFVLKPEVKAGIRTYKMTKRAKEKGRIN